jgi:hypothetical protein
MVAMPKTTDTLCARCGERPVEPGQHLCTQCREEVGPAARDSASAPPPSDLDERSSRWPATMVKPSPVQFHATIMVTIFLVLAALGVWAFLSHKGVGPFDSKVTLQGPVRNGSQTIVVTVTNQGSRASRATCSFRALDESETQLAAQTVLTPSIPAHGSIEVTQTFRGLEITPAGFDTVCS